MKCLRLVFLLGLVSAIGHTQQPAISEGGVVNAASFAAGLPITPGSLVSIFGSDLASGIAQADSIPISTSRLNTRVLFNGIAAPILFLFPGGSGAAAQINAQVPWGVGGGGATPGTAAVVVERDGVASQPRQVQVSSFSPGIFTVEFGVGQAIATNAVTGALAAPPGSIAGAVPIRRGEYLTIWCTGLGQVDPPVATADIPRDQVVHFTTTAPAVIFGEGTVVEGVAAISPQFVGVYQANVQVPENAPVGNAVPLKLRAGGLTSRDAVTIAIQ